MFVRRDEDWCHSRGCTNQYLGLEASSDADEGRTRRDGEKGEVGRLKKARRKKEGVRVGDVLPRKSRIKVQGSHVG